MARHDAASLVQNSLEAVAGRNRQVRRITFIGMVGNLLLAGVKMAAGLLGGSQAVFADGVHSLSDLATDVAVLVGIRYWSAPPDEKHPHGHGRIETLVTVLIGLTLAAVAVGLGYEAVATVRSPHVQQPGWIAFWAAVLSIGVKEGLYRWTKAVARKVRSSALEANAWHHRSDALSSLPAAIAVAVAAVYPQWSFVDRIGALVVTLLILQAAWKITWPALEQLMDRGAPREQVEHIKEIVSATKGVMDLHAVRTRFLGQGYQVDLHVLVDPDITVREGHAISEKVRLRLLEFCRHIQDVVVHIEPYVQEELPEINQEQKNHSC